MSTEHESGSTGPQEEQTSGGHGVVGPAPDGAGTQSAAPSAGAAPSYPGASRETPTTALGMPAVPSDAPPTSSYDQRDDEPAPTVTFAQQPPQSPPAYQQQPSAPGAPTPDVLAGYAPPSPVPSYPPKPFSYGEQAPGVAQVGPGGPGSAYGESAPPAPPYGEQPTAPPYGEQPAAPEHTAAFAESGIPANPYATSVPGPAPAPVHHPFGAGQPVGAWGAPAGAGGPGYPGGPPGYPGDYAGPNPDGGRARKGRGGLVALVAAVALVTGGLGGVVGAAIGNNDKSNSGSSHSSTTISSGETTKASDRDPGSVAGIAAKALPSTVTIKAQGAQESGTGTGFIFDTQGHILTNNHVVAPAANGGKLTVKFADGSSYPASVVGRAEGYDVAVVKLDQTPTAKLVPLTLGDSDKVAVGDGTIAIGAPYGLEGTVTTGIISAKDRPVASGDESGAQSSYMNALQTDASINPGNSGGPLLSSNGAVIGINSAIQSNTGGGSGQAGSIGLGFAIPINQAKWVAQTLIESGKPVYAVLGILRNDDYKGDGAQIQTNAVQGQAPVTAGGPADKAGLKAGDVITKLGNLPIDSGPTLVSEIWTHKPGDQVAVEYTRDGKTQKTTVTLGERTGDS